MPLRLVFFTNETFSNGRHARIFQLCRAYQFLYPDWREQDVIEAVVEYNRDRHDPAYPDSEAIRLAKDAYKAIWQTEQAKKDLDEALHKKCKEPLEAVKWALSSLGLTVQLNDMNQKILINEGKDDRDLNSLSTQVYNELRTQLSHDNVRKNLCLLAKQQTIHPVLQYLQGLPSSDDDSELKKLYELMQIEDESKWYERATMKKWLMQAVCMLHNSTAKDFDADIVLVLRGKQRCGKTSLCRKLAVKGAFFNDGISLDPDNVDSVRIATSAWLTELGELASTTTRRDLHALKTFFTHRADTYRIPFAEWYEEIPRKTVFVGTVNDERFLKDDTGNSRYHVIEVPYMSYEQIQAIDTDRLWSYIYTLVEAKSSTPNPQNKDKFENYVASVKEKFVNTLSLTLACCLHRYDQYENVLPSGFNNLDLSTVNVKFVLVTKEWSDDWLQKLHNVFVKEMSGIAKIWNLPSLVAVLNDKLAKQKNLIIE